jgi:serine/threonine protein kinase
MSAASLQGQTLGNYHVLDPLGRGGMAQVYRAYHPQLDRYAAVKVLRPDLVEEEGFLVRFRREAQAVAALRNPHIVQVFDFDVQGDNYYMVMELLEGDTLKTRLDDYHMRGERMPLGEIVRVLLDVLDGLAYAHQEGMAHRDVKPSNIMLTRSGQTVITDFGIAQIIGGTQHTVSGMLMGTLNYMAPEQGLKGHSDARSDIYSLGIVLYEMLTQQKPFEADTPLAILMKHLNDPLPLPRQIDPAIPESFERVLLRALAKDPGERYQSAEEMATGLREATQGAEVEIPEHISLPLSFTTQEAPSDWVSVLSGTVRDKIQDAEFAGDDTDAALGQRLAAEQAARMGIGRRLLRAIGLHRRTVSQVSDESLRRKVSEARQEQIRRTLGAVGLVSALAVVMNVLALGVGSLTGQWVLLDRGWPMELFLVGLAFCIIMVITSSIWMLIPVGIVLGNGVLFSYSALTGNWDHWVFLWALDLLLVTGSVFLTVWLSGYKDSSRSLSRILGWTLGLMAATCSFILPIAALFLSQ